MSFRLVSKSVILNDLEWRNSLILGYFTEFGSFRVGVSNYLYLQPLLRNEPGDIRRGSPQRER